MGVYPQTCPSITGMDLTGERVTVLDPEPAGFDAVLASWLDTLVLDGLVPGRPAEATRRKPQRERPF